jgi:hypothetical protein
MLATKPYQEMYLYDCGSIPLSSDVTADPNRLNPRLAEMMNFRKEIKVWGSDSWAYDTLSMMEDGVADALVGILTGMSAADAGRQLQGKIEDAEK